MQNRTEWEIVDDEPGPESRPRPGLHALTGPRWKLACLAALGAIMLAGLAIVAGIFVFVLALIGMAAFGITRIRLALRRLGVPWSKSGDSLNRFPRRPSNW